MFRRQFKGLCNELSVGLHLPGVHRFQHAVGSFIGRGEFVGLEIDDMSRRDATLFILCEYKAVNGAGGTLILLIVDGDNGLLVVDLLSGLSGEEVAKVRLLQGLVDDFLIWVAGEILLHPMGVRLIIPGDFFPAFMHR